MSFRNYEIFYEVAKTLSFTKAANNLYISQSAVSYAMANLETKANTKLFTRLHQGVELTKSGEVLYQRLIPLMQNYESLENNLENLEQASTIRIGSCITFAYGWLNTIINDLKLSFSNLKYQVVVNSAQNILKMLDNQEIDIAFIEGKLINKDYIIENIGSYELSLYASTQSKLKTITFNQLLQQPLIVREKGSAIRTVVEGLYNSQGYELKYVMESVNSQVMIKAVENNLGIAFLPDVLINQDDQVKKIKTKQIKLTNEFSVVVLKSNQDNQYIEMIKKTMMKNKSPLL